MVAVIYCAEQGVVATFTVNATNAPLWDFGDNSTVFNEIVFRGKHYTLFCSFYLFRTKVLPDHFLLQSLCA